MRKRQGSAPDLRYDSIVAQLRSARVMCSSVPSSPAGAAATAELLLAAAAARSLSVTARASTAAR